MLGAGLPLPLFPRIMATPPSNEPKIIYTMVRVSKSHEKKQVLKEVSLSYYYGAKIGVLGLNGSGKSSLLRIMAGVDKEFEGQAILHPGYTLGFLSQEPQLNPAQTVKEAVSEGVAELAGLLSEYDDTFIQMGEVEGAELDAVLARCTEVESGARNIDHILNGTLLPDMAARFLARMADGHSIGAVTVGLDANGTIEYRLE